MRTTSTLVICTLILAAVAASPSARSKRETEAEIYQKILQDTKEMKPCLTNLSSGTECKVQSLKNFMKIVKNTPACKEFGEDSSQCSYATAKACQEDYANCFLGKLTAIDASSGAINAKAVKDGVFGSSTLSAAGKQSAMKTFDACMVAPLPSPYSSFQYKTELIPPALKKLSSLMAQAKSMGQLTPTKLILVIDCLDVAIFQSGCAQSDAVIIKRLEDRLIKSFIE